MDFWTKARSFAEEAAKRTQDLSFGASSISDVVAETTKRSKEIAAQASKRADQIRIEAVKRADLIKHLADGIITPATGVAPTTAPEESHVAGDTLEKFGITEELREFVKGITPTTFRDFPLEDDTQMFDVPTLSNVRQDLTEWQEKHASLVLSTVKEISKLRYELCPRVMKERKFWRIYFILMNSHIEPYEKRYMENAKLKLPEQAKDEKAIGKVKDDKAIEQVTNDKAIEQVKDDKAIDQVEDDKAIEQVKDDKAIEHVNDDKAIEQLMGDKAIEQVKDDKAIEQVKDDKAIEQAKDDKAVEQAKDDKAIEPPEVRLNSNQGLKEVKKEKRPSLDEQDLDEFLLGDLGDSDEGPDDGDLTFDDDLDKW